MPPHVVLRQWTSTSLRLSHQQGQSRHPSMRQQWHWLVNGSLQTLKRQDHGQNRLNCGRPCQDCGQHECIGWNTKWPEKNCQTGWANCEETKPRGIFKFQV